MHLWLAVTAVIAALTGGLWLMSMVSPEEAQIWQQAVVYGAAFLGVFGLATLLGYLVRAIFWPGGLRYEHLKSSRRQGILLGFLAVVSLILQAAAIFNSGTALLLLIIFGLLELYVQ